MSEIYSLLEELIESDDEFLEEQSLKVTRYIKELEVGIITEGLCRSYIQDVRDLMQINNIRGEIKNKALAQKIIEELTKLLIKGVASAIKGVL